MVIVYKDNTMLYQFVTETRTEGILHVRNTFGIDVDNVKEPQAIILADRPYVIMFKAVIPEHLHIKEEYREADIYIVDDFSYYPDKVKAFYSSFTKDELYQEVLKYRVNEVANGDVGSIIR